MAQSTSEYVIEILRKAYGPLKQLTQKQRDHLTKTLKAKDKKRLKDLYRADIRWVSIMANEILTGQPSLSNNGFRPKIVKTK